jgi:hypothetical protein
MYDRSGYTLDGDEMLHVLRQMAKGPVVGDEDIVVNGKKIIIPEGMTELQVVVALIERAMNREEVTRFDRTYRYRPYDGAHAAWAVLRKLYGFVDGHATMTAFGPIKPIMITINVGLNETAQVPWGKLRISTLDNAVVELDAVQDGSRGIVFQLKVDAKRKYAAEIDMLFDAIEDHLTEHSIYRGKAIKAVGVDEPQFMDLSKVDPAQVVYSAKVQRQLDANVFGPMRMTTVFDAISLGVGTSVLLAGDYGTGKTLAGYLAGQVAVAHGWTAIYSESGDDLEELLELAELYGPGLLFYEDIDSIAGDDAEHIEALLEAFDGAKTKGRKVLTVLTANKPEIIHAAMLRCGRTDVLIRMGELDAASVESVIAKGVRAGLLGVINYDTLAKAMEGFTPAFVAEVFARALRYALLESKGRLDFKLHTDNLLDAVAEVRVQHDMMVAAKERPPLIPAGAAFMAELAAAVADKLGGFRVDEMSGQLVQVDK